MNLTERKINLGVLVNPFYLYCLSFTLAIFLYYWGWSDLYPELSFSLLAFLVISFAVFLFLGNKVHAEGLRGENYVQSKYLFFDEVILVIILILALINVVYMGYLPVIEHSVSYKEYGMPVIDPLFNSLSIFISVYYFGLFLNTRRKKYLLYISVFLLIHLCLFRRSSIVWITTGSVLEYIFFKGKVRTAIILLTLILVPVFAWLFGVFGNTRSHLGKDFVLNDLKASTRFKESGVNYNDYMTYLYLSSPLANLQQNLEPLNSVNDKTDFKRFMLYCIVPESITLRLEKNAGMVPPEYELISPNLIVGTLYMAGACTMGWPGMFLMLIYLIFFIGLCLMIVHRMRSFNMVTYSLLCTTVILLIFSNFLNRLDIIMMLFVYPVLFEILFRKDVSLHLKH